MESAEYLRDLAKQLPDSDADRLKEIAGELEGLDLLVDDYMVADRNRIRYDD